jgi:hypothetical protein
MVLGRKGLAMISYFEEGTLKYDKQKETGGWSIETLAATIPSYTWAGYRSSQSLDIHGFPHIVYEDSGTLRHIYWNGKAWQTQLISRSGSFRLRYASITIGSDDTIFISYFDPDDGSLKVAVGVPSASADSDESKTKSAN